MTLALIDGDFLLHSCMWETNSFNNFKSNLEHAIAGWTDGAFCDDYVLALGPFDGHNYRNDLFDGYKKSVSREKQRKKKLAHFDESKEYLYNRKDIVIGDYIEADDLLGHWSTQVRDSVIITADKDLNQIPGMHYTPYYKNPHLYEVTEQEAKDFLKYQLLIGDSIDNIPGIRGVGPVRAASLLEKFDGDIPAIYESICGEEWKETFLSNGKLLFIQREPDQHFTMDLYERELA